MSGLSNVRPSWAAAVWVLRSWLVLALSILLVTAGAWAGDECQEIQLDGVAGGSGSTVVVRVVDASPHGIAPDPALDVISESCALSIAPGEPAANLIRRIPGFWGDGLGGTPIDRPLICARTCTAGQVGNACTVNAGCDVMINDGLGICGEQPKKTCGNTQVTGRSCTIEAKVSQVKGKCDGGTSDGKSCSAHSQCPGGDCPGSQTLRSCDDAAEDETCTKKRSLKICCRATPLCKGAKLAGEDDNIPITVQTKIVPGTPDCTAGDWCPAAIPGDNTQPLRFKADPIDGRPGPYASQRDCRAALQSAAGTLTQTTFTVLKDCRRKVMAGTLPPGSCAAVNPTSDPDGAVAAASAALGSTVDDHCTQSGRSPSDFGYTSCPAPCDGIDLALCSAGTVGAPCQRNRNCDTTPGAGDGVCGDWSTLTSCTTCGATAAGEAAVAAVYGGVGPGVPAPAQNCQNRIGDDIAALLAVELKDAASCQKSLDTFKILLSDRTPKCKDADHKRKRAKARAAIATDVAAACNNAALAQLDTCASNMAGLLHCAPRIVRRVIAAVADAAAPEGRCGDGKKGIGESCDDGNILDSDGCDSNCTPTACGNEVISTGEECDDGNLVPGDGCDPTCHSEPQPCPPQMCTNFTFDCSALFPGDCGCLRTAEGGGLCVNNFDCTSAQPCSTTTDCSTPGERCYLDTCCGGSLQPGRCGPPTCTGQPQ